MELQRHSQIRHLQKTAQSRWAVLIFPYKSILSSLNHLACSSLNLLQFVYISPGPSCLEVNTMFRCSEFAWHTHCSAQRIPRRALAVSRAKNGPAPVSKGAISFCSRADRLLFLVSDCQAAAFESLRSHYIFQKVTLLVACGCIDTGVIAHCHVHSVKLCPL